MKTLADAPADSLAQSLMETLPQTSTQQAGAMYSATQDRRLLLRTVPNPDHGSDYVVRFEIETTPSFSLGPLKIVVRYVPDKLLLEPASLSDYVHALTQPRWTSLESVVLAMRDDFGNEVIPRWIEIVVSPSESSLDIARHSVLVEDRQPQWDNRNLLARLRDCQ